MKYPGPSGAGSDLNGCEIKRIKGLETPIVEGGRVSVVVGVKIFVGGYNADKYNTERDNAKRRCLGT